MIKDKLGRFFTNLPLVLRRVGVFEEIFTIFDRLMYNKKNYSFDMKTDKAAMGSMWFLGWDKVYFGRVYD